MNLNPENGIVIFTDGSCYHKDRIGGWAWVALDSFGNEYSESGGEKNTTISRMELHAATHALECMHKHFGPIPVMIKSDSEYVVLGASNKSRKRKANLKEWKRLDDAEAEHVVVIYEHVRGHSGNSHNDKADKLAQVERKKIVSELPRRVSRRSDKKLEYCNRRMGKSKQA